MGVVFGLDELCMSYYFLGEEISSKVRAVSIEHSQNKEDYQDIYISLKKILSAYESNTVGLKNAVNNLYKLPKNKRDWIANIILDIPMQNKRKTHERIRTIMDIVHDGGRHSKETLWNIMLHPLSFEELARKYYHNKNI